MNLSRRKKSTQIKTLIILLMGGFLLSANSQASVRKEFNYQGKLTNASGVAVPDGAYDVVFNLYTVAGGGSPVWTEGWTAAALFTEATTTMTDDGCAAGVDKVAYTTGTNEGSLAAGQTLWNTTLKESAVIQSVVSASNYICIYAPASTWNSGNTVTNRLFVKNGLFSVMVGSVTPQTVQFTGTDYYLGVTVGSDTEMIPRKKLGAVPQAWNANALVGDGHIDIDRTSSAQDAANINYNPASGSFSALSLIYGAGGGTGSALSILQSGTGNILDAQNGSGSAFLVSAAGRVGIGSASPTAYLHLKAGAAAANSAPLKFTAGINLATPEAGVMEYDGTNLYFTPVAARNLVAQISGSTALTAGSIPFAGTNGYLNEDNANFFWDSANKRLGIGTSTPDEALEVNGKVMIGNNTVSGENVTFDSSTAPGLRLANANGYISLTPLNAYWAHIYTDRNSFIFNAPVYSSLNAFSSYDNNLLLQRNGTTKITVGSAAVTLADALQVSGTGDSYFNGQLGLGISSPTATLHLKAGSAAANTAPLKFTAGTNLATPEAGVMEYDGTNLYFTPSTVRRTIAFTDSNITGSAYYLTSRDTRTINDEPDDFNAVIKYDFKNNATNGLSDGGTYNSVMTWRGYGSAADMSGGPVLQMAYSSNKNLWTRFSTSATAWGTWTMLLDSDTGVQLQSATPGSAQTGNLNISGTGIFGTGLGLGVSTPTAVLHLKAGAATAGTAPLKFTAGTNLATPEAGAMEYDGTQLYFSPNTTRNLVAQISGSTALTAGSIPFAGTNGYLNEDNANFFWDNANKRLGLGTNTPSAVLNLTSTGSQLLKATRTGVFDFVQYQRAGGTWTNITAEAGISLGTVSGDVLDATGDALYVGKADKFSSAYIDVGTAISAGGTFAWEYWNGSAWATLTATDGTSTANGALAQDGVVSFTPPVDWATTTQNSSAQLYFIRLRATGGSFGTEPTVYLVVPNNDGSPAMEVYANGGDTAPTLSVTRNGGVYMGVAPTAGSSYRLYVSGAGYISSLALGGTLSGVTTLAASGAITDTIGTTGYTHVGGLILNGPNATATIPNQNSPVLRLSSRAWNGSASRENSMDIYVNPDAEYVTNARMAFKTTTLDGIADASELMNLDTNGKLSVLGRAQSSDDMFDRVFSYVGSAYTDQTLNVSSFGVTTGDVLDVVGNYVYVGKENKFGEMYFDFGTIMSAGTTRTWEYWNGSAWATLSVTDGTSDWQNDGSVTFTAPGDWNIGTVNNTPGLYWVRVGTASGTFTVEPTLRILLPNTTAITKEVLSNNEFDDTSKWTTTGDWAYTTSDYTFTYASGTGTLRQASADFNSPLEPNTWYRFRYVVGVAAPATTVVWIGDEVATGKTYFSGSTTEVDVFFKTNPNPGDFVLYTTATATSGFRLDSVFLKKLEGGNIYASGDIRVDGILRGNGTEGIKIASSGNVGIGTLAPTAVLHLKAGTAAANTAPLKFTSGTNLTTAEAGAMEYDGTNLYFTPVAARNLVAQINGATALTAGSIPFATTGGYLTEDSDNFFWDDANNRLGVGTDAPDTQVTIKQANDTSGLRLYGYTVPTSYFDMFLNSAGNPRFSTNASMVFEAGGGVYFRSGATGTFFNDGTPRNTNFNNGQLYLNGTGRLGLGTTSPTAYLHLRTGAAAANSAPLKFSAGTNLTTPEAGAMEYNGAQLYFSPSTTRNILAQVAGSTALSAGSVPFATTSGYLEQDNANFFWDDANNRLGIGTNSPGARLEVSPSIEISGSNPNLTLSPDTGTQGRIIGASGFDYHFFPDMTSGNVYFGYNSNLTNLYFGTSGTQNRPYNIAFNANSAITFGMGADGVAVTEAMRIDSGGNVGIGITSPTAVLHLKAGSATAGTAPLKLTSGTNLTTPEAGAMEYDGTNLYFTPSTTRKTIAFTDSDISTMTGTLGVAHGGTGATTLTGVLKGNGTSAISAMTGTANYAARWTDANTLGVGVLYDNGTGVGIGTTSPGSYKLNVTGNTYLNGTLTATGAIAANGGLTQGGNTILNGVDTWLRTTGSTGWYSASYGGGWYMTDTTWIRNYNAKPLYMNGDGAYSAVLMGGNVGIGTTTPSSKLDIWHSSTSTALTVAQSGTGNIIDLKDGASSVFYIADGGNVTATGSMTVGGTVVAGKINTSNIKYTGGGNYPFENAFNGATIEDVPALNDFIGNQLMFADARGYTITTSGSITNATNAFRQGDSYSTITNVTQPIVVTVEGIIASDTNVQNIRAFLQAHGSITAHLLVEVKQANDTWVTLSDEDIAIYGREYWFSPNITSVAPYPASWNLKGVRYTITSLSQATSYIRQFGIYKYNGFRYPFLAEYQPYFYGQIMDSDGGSAALPSYTWSGDTNTGMFSPGAEMIGFAVSGSEKFRIDDSGNVGIGATAPSQKLDVQGNLAIASNFIGGGLGYGNSGSPANYATLQMYNSATGYTTLDNLGYGIKLQTASTDRLTILNGGNVGIGVSSPSAVLHLKAGSATAGTAPLKFTSGTNLTTPEAGSMEYDGTNLYFTPSTTRKTIAFTDSDITGTAANITGTVTVAHGGTGLTSLTQNGILYGNGTGNVGVTAAGTSNYILYSNAGTPAWTNAPTISGANITALNAGNISSGTLSVARGGTGATTLTGVLKGNGTSAISAMTGTQNYAARWTDANTLGIGTLYDNGTNVGIGTNAPDKRLTVQLSDAAGVDEFKILDSAGASIFTVDSDGNTLWTNTMPTINFNNAQTTNINTIAIADPGAGEGMQWTGTNWSIDSSPLDRSNNAGNLNLYGTANDIALWRPSLWVYNSSNYATATAQSDGGLNFTTTGTGDITLNPGGNVGIGVSSPTAVLHLKTGSATAGTAPLKFTSGTNLTTPEAGAMEYDGTNLYFTPSTTRKTIAFTDSDITGSAANVTGTVTVAHGGTGLTSLTQNGILYGNGTGNVGVTAAGTSNYILYSNAGTPAWTNAPTISGANITALSASNISSGTLSVARGGTGATTLTGVLKGNGTSAISAMTGTQNYAARWTDANTLGVGVLYDNGTNVGIGTTSPASKLDIAQNSTSTALTVNQSGTGMIVDIQDAGTSVFSVGQATVTVARPLDLQVEGDVGIEYDLAFLNNAASYITSAGPLTLSAGDRNSYENLTLTTGGTGDITMDIADSVRGFQMIGATGQVLGVTPAGAMGVGVADPTAVLHLKAGSATASTAPLKFTSGTSLTTPEAGSVEYDGTQLYFSPTTTRNILAQVAGATALTAGSVPFATTNGYLAQDNANFFWDDTNKWLGLGTNSPEAHLTVVQPGVVPEDSQVLASQAQLGSTVSVQGDGQAYFMGRDVTNDIEFIMGTSSVGAAFAGSATSHSFQLRTNNTTRLTIRETSGNVGIGTVSPTALLHLKAGTATASTAPLKFTSGTNLTTAEAGAMEYDGTNLYFTPSTTRKTIAFTDSNITGNAANVTGTVTVGHGGTGLTTLTQNGILYGNGTGNVGVTAAGTNNYLLYSNNGTPAWTNAPTISGANITNISFGNITSGVVAAANGGTGINSSALSGVPHIVSGTWSAMTGTANYAARWTDANTLGTGTLYDNGTSVGIGTASPGSYRLNVSGTTYISSTLTVGGTITGVKNALNTVSSNLGTPTLEEMALFQGEFNNKLRFVPAVLQEQSADGVTWTPSTRASANALADIMLGEGQTSSINIIPAMSIGGSGYYRLTWDADDTGYVYLNAFYAYTSTQGNTVNVKLEKYHNTTGWTEMTNGNVNNWPGHVYIPHTSVPFNASNVNYYGQVRATFSVTSAASTNAVYLYAIEWFGGYPAGRRNVEAYDRDKNVTFPAQVRSYGFTFGSDFDTGMFGPATDNLGLFTGNLERLRIDGSGNVGIGTVSPTALLHLKAGTATANTAPLKFTSGTNLTTPEAGSVEYDGTQLYFSPSATRNLVAQVAGATALTAGSIPFATTNGYLAGDSANFFWDDANDRLGIGTDSPFSKLNLDFAASPTEANYKTDLAYSGLTAYVPYSTSSVIPLATGSSDAQSKPMVGIWGYVTGSGSYLRFGTSSAYVTGVTNTAMSIDYNGRVGIGVDTPTAVLNLKAGSATANTAPLKFTSGTNLTTPEAGAMEYDGTNLYFSPSTTRKTVAFTDSNITGNAANVTGTVTVGHGGTGLTTLTQNGILYGNGTGNVGVTAAGTNNYLLYSNAGTPAWTNAPTISGANITSLSAGNISSGTLVVARGGTGATTLTGVLKGNGTSAISAMTGTQNYAARWTDANTLGVGTLYDNGTRVGIGTASPTAYLTLRAGTASANTAPLKFTSGTNLTTAEAGAMEYDGTQLYFTPASTRNVVAQITGGALTPGSIPFATTSGYLTGENANFFWDDANNRLGLGTNTPSALLTLKSTSDGATLGGELLDANNWTTTGWTGTFAAGFTHTTGNTTALSRTLTSVVGDHYIVSFTLAGRTAGNFTLSLGANQYSDYFYSDDTYSFGLRTLTASAPLVFTPTSDFNGTVSAISVKEIDEDAASSFNLTNAAGEVVYEMRSSFSGYGNLFMGLNVGEHNVTGEGNTGVGADALYHNMSGSYNSAFGFEALYSNTAGRYNTALGMDALYNNISGHYNTAVGYNAMGANTVGDDNVAVGMNSLRLNTTGDSNTAMGVRAMDRNTTGDDNTAVGNRALMYNVVGGENSAFGYQALYYTTGSYNSAMGRYALYDLTTGNLNTAIGRNTGRGITTGSYNTIIGAGVTGLAADLSNTIILADGEGNQRFYIDALGRAGLGTTTPTARLTVDETADGDIVNVLDAGVSIFKVGQATVDVTRPLDLQVEGDVGMEYNLRFLSNATSYITSAGPLVLSAGDSNSSENLTLTTSGTGDIVIDISGSILGLGVMGAESKVFSVDPQGNVVLGGVDTGAGDLSVKGDISTLGGNLDLNALETPSGVAVTPVGTAGSTTYGYRVSAINSNGETLAATVVTTTTGNATLSATNYNRITWSAVPGATGYKVYGRTAGSQLYMATVNAPVLYYNDTLAVATPAGAVATVNDTGGNNITYAPANGPKRSIILTAAGAEIPTTGGAAQTKVTGSYHTYYVLDFDAAANESAYWHWTMPDSYDGGPIDVTYYWEVESTSTNSVIWCFQTVGVTANSEGIDSGISTAICETDAGLGVSKRLASVTESMAASGFSAGEYVAFKVYRDAASDTLAADARLVKVKVEYSVNAESD